MQKTKRSKHRERGSEFVEFSLVVIPFLAMITVLMDVSWAAFVKGSLQRAVRVGVTQGVSMTQTQITAAGGKCLTDTVKSLVQQNSFGILSGTSLIYVNYLQPPAPGSTAAATDVSTTSEADTPGNIMQVSIQNYSLLPLIPRIVSLNQGTDNNPLNLTVYAAGIIQLESDSPTCVGSAP
jgi:Flp pilus assembly protein TadG